MEKIGTGIRMPDAWMFFYKSEERENVGYRAIRVWNDATVKSEVPASHGQGYVSMDIIVNDNLIYRGDLVVDEVIASLATSNEEIPGIHM